MLKTIKRLIAWTGPYKGRLQTGYLFSFLSAMFTAMPIMLAAYGLNLVIEDWRGIRPLSGMQICLILLGLVLLVLARAFFSYLRATWQDSIAYEQTAGERIKIGDILKRVSLGFFSKTTTGEISAAVTTDLTFFEMYAMKMLDTLVTGYISAGVMVLGMLVFSPLAALISVIGIGLSAAALHALALKSKRNAPVHQKAQDDMVAAVLEYVRGISLVKAFKYDGIAAKNVSDALRAHCDINIKIEKGYAIFNALHLTALKTASVCIVLASAMLALSGGLQLPVLLMMLMYSFVVFGNVEAMNGATHVMKILDETMDKLEKIEKAEFIDSDGKDLALDAHSIRFENVSFSYDSRKVIDNANFEVPEKTVTAIVGPSGGGKTTLASLMARFYDVDSGAVLVGGHNVKEMTCDSLLSHYSMVFQKVYLFNDTIENNIRFGKPDATMDEVMDAAKKAACHTFIMGLPEGYQTLVGEGGSTLSGGEKQRISIARAILKNAPIVILDEATASIDPENEYLIQQAIGNLVQDKTLVIIAHRLATVEAADQILVVEDGRIAEKGRHAELLACGGTYRRFWELRRETENWEIK